MKALMERVSKEAVEEIAEKLQDNVVKEKLVLLLTKGDITPKSVELMLNLVSLSKVLAQLEVVSKEELESCFPTMH